MSIHEIRILPPLAIARLGSSPEPLANYDVSSIPPTLSAFAASSPRRRSPSTGRAVRSPAS
jgi:hypothetical protein